MQAQYKGNCELGSVHRQTKKTDNHRAKKQMRILGISSMFHDAAVSVVEDGKVLFAAHAERYSKQKNDPFVNSELIDAALEYGKPDVIVLHEKDWAKRLRNLLAGNWSALREPSQRWWLKTFYPQLAGIPIRSPFWHHETHAAAGVLTSDFDDAAVMVIDAIGEFNTATIWHWKNNMLERKHEVNFPSSLGLFYSAVTAHCGLKPMEDEYILMGMAAYGDETIAKEIKQQMQQDFFVDNSKTDDKPIHMKQNLQRGLPTGYEQFDDFDMALAAQMIVEDRIYKYAAKALYLTKSENLVYMGGVALNCVANGKLFELFKNIHIMPNPGDAGSALGAAALYYHNKTGNRTDWPGAYLGYEIKGKYPVKKALDSLEKGEIFGVANGRAEFGPRALGNRSLMADPRGDKIKDRMNEIKRRQKFRPFAPVILEEHVHDYFEMPAGCLSPYMQFTAVCKYPEQFPAIIHHDGTSRVQTVNREQNVGLYKLLTRFYKKTGCPMLVNTSLNIKGQPIVNDEADAAAFAEHYGINVHTRD